MSKFIRTNALVILCAFALAFAATAGVEAQTDDPILDEDILVSIQVDDTLWVAPVALQTEFETHFNAPGVVESASALMLRLPVATPVNGVRLEGGFFSPALKQDLEALGYGTETALVVTEVPGATIGYVHTL